MIVKTISLKKLLGFGLVCGVMGLGIAWSGDEISEFEIDPNSPAVYLKFRTASSPRELVWTILETTDASTAHQAMEALEFLEHPYAFDQVRERVAAQVAKHPLMAKWRLSPAEIDDFALKMHTLANQWFKKPGVPWTWSQLEQWVREGPPLASGAPTGFSERILTCEHLKWTSRYFLYVPTTYDATKAYPLLMVLGGGNNRMGPQKAGVIAASVLAEWTGVAEKMGWIVAAPASPLGWDGEGFSLLLSAEAEVTRHYRVDPDRVYAWGQSLGGHASWKLAMSIPDRWAGVAPVCGGYGAWGPSMVVTNNLPIYHVWGEEDGMSAGANRSLAQQLKAFGYDDRSVAKPGGHMNFEDEFPNILAFFGKRPRQMYPKAVIGYVSEPDVTGETAGEHPWTSPLPWTKRHYWLECVAKQDQKKVGLMKGELKGPNAIALTLENIKTVKVYLHEKMGMDLEKPITISINGRPPVALKAERSLEVLFHDQAVFHDRGRVFLSALILDVLPEPK